MPIVNYNRAISLCYRKTVFFIKLRLLYVLIYSLEFPYFNVFERNLVSVILQ